MLSDVAADRVYGRDVTGIIVVNGDVPRDIPDVSAQACLAIFKNSNTVETLAYALAENGRFEQAASSLLEAVALDSYEAVRDQRATRVNSRMADVFRDGKTYLEDLQNNEETH